MKTEVRQIPDLVALLVCITSVLLIWSLLMLLTSDGRGLSLSGN
jgi:hypothetical protein